MWLPITLGESLGRGHFYLAETRTFLLCVDTKLPLELVHSQHVKSSSPEKRDYRNVGSNVRRLKFPDARNISICVGRLEGRGVLIEL